MRLTKREPVLDPWRASNAGGVLERLEGGPSQRPPWRDAVALLLTACQRGADRTAALVNGAAGVVAFEHGRPHSVMGFTVRGGKIVEIYVLADPARLDQLDLAVLKD